MELLERARIVLTDLPVRQEPADRGVEPGIVADEGGNCYQNCDCRFGLICRESVCVSDW